MAFDYRWYKNMSYDKKVELGYIRKGTMPITKMCKDDEELKAYKEASKGIRNIKNLEFKVDNKNREK
jgi:hypothetical protein